MLIGKIEYRPTKTSLKNMLDRALNEAETRLNEIHASALAFEASIDPLKPKAHLKEFIHTGQIIGTYSVLEHFIRSHIQDIYTIIAREESHLGQTFRRSILAKYNQCAYDYFPKYGKYEKSIGAKLETILALIVDTFADDSISKLEIGLWSGPIGNASIDKVRKIYNYLNVDLQQAQDQLFNDVPSVTLNSKFSIIDQLIDRRNIIAHTIETGILDATTIFQDYQTPLLNFLKHLTMLVKFWFIQREFECGKLIPQTPIAVHGNSIVCLSAQAVFNVDSSVFAIANGNIIKSCSRIESMEINSNVVAKSVVGSDIGVKVGFRAKSNYKYLVLPNNRQPFS